jgi:hypothetical protein
MAPLGWRGIKVVEELDSSVGREGAIDGSPAKAVRGYKTVKIPDSLADALDRFLREPYAELYGFRSRADVVVYLLVGFLESQGVIRPRVRPRLEHVNLYETHALVRDNLLNVTAEVWFTPPTARCSYCHSTKCIHAEYALTLEKARAVFESRGVRLARPGRTDFGYVVDVDGSPYPMLID